MTLFEKNMNLDLDIGVLARRKGYRVGPVWHGSPDRFTTFDESHFGKNIFSHVIGFFFSNNRKEAESYSKINRWDGKSIKNGVLYEVYLKIKNPAKFDIYNDYNDNEPALWVDANSFVFNAFKFPCYNDAVIVKNKDTGDILYIVPHPAQIKLADYITYDDAGKPIPIEQRFDSSNPDIRY